LTCAVAIAKIALLIVSADRCFLKASRSASTPEHLCKGEMSRTTYHKPTDGSNRLNEAERLFIWGFRAMAQRQRLGWPAMDGIRAVYEHFHVEDAVPSLDAMLEAFASTAYTAIELHAPACPCVSNGEFRLLKATSIAQQGDIDRSRRQFEYWLPELAADWIIAPVCGLGTIFRTAGLLFPSSDIPSLTTKMQSSPVVSRALH
jgi:hypothetical protein